MLRRCQLIISTGHKQSKRFFQVVNMCVYVNKIPNPINILFAPRCIYISPYVRVLTYIRVTQHDYLYILCLLHIE